eukprot:Platyproteum_vivax@DN604_c0_g1_i1.p1
MMASEEIIQSSFPVRLSRSLRRLATAYLDKTTPHRLARWLAFLACCIVYGLRVYYLQGFYVVTYGIGIYLLNQLIGFLSPAIDPETAGPVLPTSDTDEFRPFHRRLPEFKFWYSGIKAVVVCTFLTFFQVFDLPVFWPVLVVYFVMLFCWTMKNQIKHMIKYKYVPFSFGKQKYGKKETTPGDTGGYPNKSAQ